MKKSFFAAGILLLNYFTYAQSVPALPACLALKDAEKVMGQPAKLVESNTEKKNGIVKFRCTYTAIDADSKTGKLGNVYYMAEEYPSGAAAHDTLAKFKEQNRNLTGWKNMSGVGDEAITHIDKNNFQLVIVRLGNKMIRIKVNKVTSLTAPVETMLAVSERMASKF